MKVEQLIARSLRLIQVVDARQPVTAADMATGILALNGMMRRIEADGTALGWHPVANPSDELPLPPEAEQAIAFNLAVLLAPEYGVDVSPVVASAAVQGMNDLLRDQAVATPIQPILAAPAASETHGGDLSAGSWYAG